MVKLPPEYPHAQNKNNHLFIHIQHYNYISASNTYFGAFSLRQIPLKINLLAFAFAQAKLQL
jgi:hypothetical protein